MEAVLKWYKIPFWLLGCMLLSGLTLKAIVPLIHEYEFNNVDVEMNVSSANGVITLPQLVLWIPRSNITLRNIAVELRKFHRTGVFNCNDCEKLANRSWDVWSSMNFTYNMTVDDYYRKLSAALCKKLLIEGVVDDFAVLNVSNLSWNLPIVDAAWDLLVCVLAMDTKINNGTVWKWKECYGTNDWEFEIGMRKMDKIFERITDIICVFMEFRFSPWDTCKENFENTLGVFTAGGYAWEVPMLPNGSHFVFMSTNGGVTWPAMHGDELQQFFLQDGLALLAWPGPVYVFADAIFSSEASVGSGREWAQLSFSTIFTVSDKRKTRRCYNESSATTCKSNCILKNIVDECQCIPFTFRKHIPCKNQHLPYCNTTMYSNCHPNKMNAEIECQSNCVCPLQHTRYQWHIITGNGDPSAKRSIKLHIKPSSAPTPLVEFTMIEKYTFEQFFSQMASFVNLCLGISGLELIAWSVLAIDYLLKWFKKKQENCKNDGQNETANHELQGVPCGIQNLEQTLEKIVNSHGIMLEEIKSIKQRLDAIEGQ